MASTVSPFKRNAAPAANKTSSMGLLGTNAAREGFFRQTSTHERDRSRRSKISTEEQLNNLLHSHDGHRYRLDRDWRGVEGITTLLYELKDELKEANESGCRPRSSIEAWATVLQANRQQQPLESLQSSYPALVAYPAAERQQHTVSEVSSQPSNLPVPDTRATAHDGQGARKDQHDAQRTPRELELEKKYKLLIQQFKDVGVALAKSRNGLEQAEHEIRVSEAKTAELSARHQKAERRLFAIRGELESKLLRIQDELKGQMIQLSQRHLSQEEKFTETISRLESLFQNQLKSQQEASVAEMDALRKTSACQRDELVQKYTTAMDELKRRFSYQSEELKCYYDSQLAANKQELQKADEGMRRMMSELDAERHDFKNEVAHLKKNAANPEELEALKRAHEELNRGHEELSRGHEELKRAHGEEVASVKEDCERKIEQCRQRFNTQVENNNREYMKHLDRLRAMKKQSEREHKEELARLELTFLGNERRNEKWTDVLLSSKFRDLQQLIDSAISPDQLVIDDRQIVAACRDIDPTNFIRRRGASAENFYALVKSSVWSILISEFFSEPFGFGAMGQSDGRASLMAVYKHWRVLLNGYHGVDPPIEVFGAKSSGDANNFRSAFFQTVMAAFEPVDREVNTAAVNTRHLQEFSIREAIRSIFNLLGKVSVDLSDLESKGSVPRLVRMSMELALQFGIHTSQLQLEHPRKQTMLKLGSECRVKGDDRTDVSVEVDLPLSPALVRIDGEEKVTIIPCTVILALQGGQE